MTRFRSIHIRLAAWYSLLLFSFMLALALAVWFGVRQSMVASVDELLAARVGHLVEFVDVEFPVKPGDAELDRDGELSGMLERIDRRQRELIVSGQHIRYDDETEFSGDTRSLQKGLYLEIATEPDEDGLRAQEVAVVNVVEELREELSEYVLTVPEGTLIDIRKVAGEPLLPGSDVIPWFAPPTDGSEFRTRDGSRVVGKRVELIGQNYDLNAASSLESVQATMDRLAGWAIWTFPVALLISVAGGVVIGKAALRPIENVASLAAAMDVDNLSRRIEISRTGDVVERLGQTFNQMLERLESSVARLEQFTADASHELRSPVSVIRTTAELALRKDRSPEELRQDMAEILHEAEQLSTLLEDLLTLARADGGTYKPPMTAVDLSEVANKICEKHQESALEAGVNLDVSAPQEAVVVGGHQPSLERLFRILVENALAHTPTGGSIHIVVETYRQGGQFSVHDTGEGIPPEHRERVFDRFYRVDAARTRASRGYGLGLSIARWLADMHEGSISVTTSPGKGSTFRVLLP